MDFAKNLLADNVRILKSQVSKTAYLGESFADFNKWLQQADWQSLKQNNQPAA